MTDSETEHNPQNPDATAQQQDRERERVVGSPEWALPNILAQERFFALAERLQLALERVGVKLTTGQVVLVASELRGEIGG